MANGEGEAELLPVNELFTIRMHPDVMSLFEIYDCEFIEVGGEFVATLLPDRRLQKNAFACPDSIIKRYFKKNKLQKISVIKDAKSLKHVELLIREGAYIDDKEDVTNYLRFMLDDMHLRKGFTFATSYLQWDLQIVTMEVESDHQESVDEMEWLRFYGETTELVVKIEGEIDFSDIDAMFSANKNITFDQLGGYSEEKRQLTEFLEHSLDGDRAMSCLIHGRPGCGKLRMGNALGRAVPSLNINIIGLYEVLDFNEKGIFKCIKRMVKSGVKNYFYFDDLDFMCGSNEKENYYDIEEPMEIVQAIEYLFDHPDVCFILGSCENIENMRPDLLSRFTNCLELGTPTKEERLEIFLKHSSWMSDSLTPKEISSVTDVCHGFVAFNIVHMHKRAKFKCEVRHCHIHGPDSEAKMEVTTEDLMEAYEFVKSCNPDLQKHAMITSPVYWDDVVGYDDLKMKVKQAFELPITHSEQFKILGLTKQRGMLLYGPPGCCKTMVARAIATEFKLNFIAVTSSDLLSMYLGESEKKVAALFKKARMNTPSLIFFDEIDSICTKRDNSNDEGTNGVLAALLTGMDGLESAEGVFMLAATNKPSSIDKALLRFKRFGQTFYVRLPCSNTRRLMLTKQLAKMHTSSDIDIECLVEKTERYSGDEIMKLCHQAGYKCLLENIEGSLETKHFLEVLKKRSPATELSSLEDFKKFELTRH